VRDVAASLVWRQASHHAFTASPVSFHGVHMTITATTHRFSPGPLLITPAAQQRLPTNEVQAALTRHLHGDWGDCDPHDAAANDQAVDDEARLFSVYHAADQTKFWIIVRRDRRRSVAA
jgi:hypothetical protein